MKTMKILFKMKRIKSKLFNAWIKLCLAKPEGQVEVESPPNHKLFFTLLILIKKKKIFSGKRHLLIKHPIPRHFFFLKQTLTTVVHSPFFFFSENFHKITLTINDLEFFMKLGNTEQLQRLPGPFRGFSTSVWQNAQANTVWHAMVCNIYFPFPKISLKISFLKNLGPMFSYFAYQLFKIFITCNRTMYRE